MDQITAHNCRFTQRRTLNEIIDRYHWRRIRVIRVAHSVRFFARRSLWINSTKGYRTLRRAMDIIVSLILIVSSLPLAILVALAIKLSDGGSVLFWQKRVGLRGRAFAFPKFRSMVPDADRIIVAIADRNHHGNSITFKMKRDPRVTWIGRILRRFSIDELPQVWCVLVGDMSLVGPRPALQAEVSKYELAQRRRLEVKPGLTCSWQVNGRADLPFSRQFELDVDYIENQALLLDLKLLIMTVPAVISGRGAY